MENGRDKCWLLTFHGHGPQLGPSVRRQRRPPGRVNILPLRGRVILEQRLTVLPAREAADALAQLGVGDVDETVPRGVAEDGALHVCGFQLAAGRQQLAVGVDDGLRDVHRVVVVLGETQRHDDAVLRRARLDRPHLIRVHGQ